MKVYVLTAVNSFGSDVFLTSSHRTFEGAKEEMMLRFNESLEEYKQDTLTADSDIEIETKSDRTIYLLGEVAIAEVMNDSAYLEHSECEDEYYYWKINESEIKD